MKTYKVIYKETLVHTFYVDAESPKEAREVFDNSVAYGELDFSDGEIDSTEVEIKEEV